MSGIIIDRTHEWEKILVQIRDHKDTLIISPSLTGMTSLLHYVTNRIKISESTQSITPIYLKLTKKTGDVIPDLCSRLVSALPFPYKISFEERRLQDFFLRLFSKKKNFHLAVFIDDIQELQKEDIQVLFENIRGVSQSRLDYPLLNHVVFIIAGHGLNLRELDPKHISPFNAARIIHLNDFQEADSIFFVNKLLPLEKYIYSKLTSNYIHYLSGGHPYIINLICDHIKSFIGFQEYVKFEKIDYAIGLIVRDLRDPLVHGVIDSLSLLDSYELETLKRILNGDKFSSTKDSLSLERLELFGLVTKYKGLYWRVRNPVFENLILDNWSAKKIIPRSQFLSRRLFVNIEAYQLIYDLENDLRDFVVTQMYNKYGEGWVGNIDLNIQNRWMGLRKSEKEGNRFSKEEYPLISYALFSDIHEIISSQWKQIFHAYFKPQRIFTGYFNALEILRNKIAHNRPLRDSEIEQLQAIAERFRSCMLAE